MTTKCIKNGKHHRYVYSEGDVSFESTKHVPHKVALRILRGKQEKLRPLHRIQAEHRNDPKPRFHPRTFEHSRMSIELPLAKLMAVLR